MWCRAAAVIEDGLNSAISDTLMCSKLPRPVERGLAGTWSFSESVVVFSEASLAVSVVVAISVGWLSPSVTAIGTVVSMVGQTCWQPLVQPPGQP